MSEPTLEQRLQAWSDDVAETYEDENQSAAEAIETLGGPDPLTQLEAMNWANNETRDNLIFMLAICISEVVRRWGTETTNQVLSGLLDGDAIAAIGDVVHAWHEADQGNMPERFRTEDIKAAMSAALEDPDNDGVVVIDMDTGEVI